MNTAPAVSAEILESVASERRESFVTDYQAIAAGVESSLGLQDFLDLYLNRIVRLYEAEAAAIWLRAMDSKRLSVRSQGNYGQMGLVSAHAGWHERLIRHALAQKKPFLLKPQAAVSARRSVSNPTKCFLLLGPLRSHGDGIAVLEVVLKGDPFRGKPARARQGLFRGFDELLGFLRQGLESRFLGNLSPIQPALVNLAATRAEIEAYKHAILTSLEVTLQGFAGSNFGSLENNRLFVRSVHALLDSNGLRVICPECESPAILRCQSAGNARTGAFLYDHYLDTGRTFHGGPTTFPRLKLTYKPPRRTTSS